MHLKHPKNINFNCNKCGICCGDTDNKTRRILLLKPDADHIANHTNQQICTFARQTPEKNPYIYEMKKNPQDGKCIFLKNNQCTIYEQRPLICKFYPFELSTSKERHYIFKFTQECPGISKTQPQTGEEGTLNEMYFKKLLQLASIQIENGSE